MQKSKVQIFHNLLLICSIIFAFLLSTVTTFYIINPNALHVGTLFNYTTYLLLMSSFLFISVTSIVIFKIIKRLQVKLHCANSRYQQMIESNQDLVWETDKYGTFRYLSPTISSLLGYQPEELLGKLQTDFMTSSDRTNYLLTFNPFLNERKPFQMLHKTFIHKNGQPLILQSSGTPIFNELDEFDGYHGFDRDITEQEKDKAYIEHMAFHDQLTGLPNRKMIEKLLIQELSRSHRHRRFGALFFIDLDNFKRVNDSLGHHVGDQLLQKVSMLVIKNIREEDTIGRLGGDEFILLLPELSDDEEEARAHASDTAYKILSLLSIPVHVDEHVLNIGGSIGIAMFPVDGHEPDDVMRHADTAMYLAKNSGKNTFKFYHQQLQTLVDQRVTIEEQLRSAFNEDQLELHYQPQCDLKTGKLTGIEALIRWRHPEDGLILPDKFISIAEESGLILKLGNWILEEACRQNSVWNQQGLCHVPIAVNLSATQFRQSNLKQTVLKTLNKTKMPAELLQIDLTEKAIMGDYHIASDILQLIKSKGGQVTIDDFGTGYSNLSKLKQMPINNLKIDRSFIENIETDEHSQAICQAIIHLANTMDLKTTAEGVETKAQQEFLKQSGCHQMQGYLFAEPLPAKDFETFIADYNYQSIPVLH